MWEAGLELDGAEGSEVGVVDAGRQEERSQQRTDRQRTCFLMSQLITFTPEWEKRAGGDRGVCERVTEALMLFHHRRFFFAVLCQKQCSGLQVCTQNPKYCVITFFFF